MTSRDPRYDILFEPVPIGPVVAKNRFFQVPHCSGMGYRDPAAEAEMRRVKAEGGWAVVCTQEVEIHPTSDITPYVELRLWDDQDIPAVAGIAQAIHDGGALAGIELNHIGLHSPNLSSREPSLGPVHLPVAGGGDDPVQARAMTRGDIAELRSWHRAAVRRALKAGYDLIYVYGGHGLSIIHHFLSRRYNDRSDEYGGSLANRARLLNEILTDTLEECQGVAAVGCRLTVDEGLGEQGITRAEIGEVLTLMGELPDLWDFVRGTWEDDSVTSRFGPEAGQEEFVTGLKALTSKPVVGVGRFTSPDTMVGQVKAGILDFIGAARPSIADPFLPAKIEAGRIEDIRECIGCNICTASDMTVSPIRCTQNPTMGEEWRRGWHPERIRPRGSDARILVAGAGPAGLEAAVALGRRGYDVALAEAGRDLGGRVVREAALPGLSAWRRVADHRLHLLDSLPNVEIYRESRIDADDALGHGFDHVAVATGARWRADGVGRWHTHPIPVDTEAQVLTPDDVMVGIRPSGRQVVVFDDDHYYMGSVLAELLASGGHDVHLVTPSGYVSSWTVNTLELGFVQKRVRAVGVTVHTGTTLTAVGAREVRTACAYTGAETVLPADAVVLVTARLPVDQLAADLSSRRPAWQEGGLRSVTVIGDAWAPSTIASSVWQGRRYAEELDGPPRPAGAPIYRRELTALPDRLVTG